MGVSQQILIAGGPSNVYATWDPANKAASITLSNGNLTAAGTTAFSKGLSTIGKSSGKWYWENTCVVAFYFAAGVGRNFDSLAIYPGGDANSCGYYHDGQFLQNGTGAGTGTSSPYTVGDIIGVALDLTGLNVYFYKNNVLQKTLALAAATTFYAICGSGGGAASLTANFGATALAYSPPAGFNAGLYD